MPDILRVTTASALLLLAATASAPVAFAQRSADGDVSLSVHGGVTQYDLSGVGSAPIYAARLDVQVAPWLMLEGGAGYSPVGREFGVKQSLLFPELQVQLQLPTPYIMPFVGVGTGVAYQKWEGLFEDTRTTQSFSAGVGVRARLGEYFGARAELRVRGFGDNFSASTADWTLGLSYRM